MASKAEGAGEEDASKGNKGGNTAESSAYVPSVDLAHDICASCDRCRASNIACDGNSPCGNCAAVYLKKNNLTSIRTFDANIFQCVYSPGKSGSRTGAENTGQEGQNMFEALPVSTMNPPQHPVWMAVQDSPPFRLPTNESDPAVPNHLLTMNPQQQYCVTATSYMYTPQQRYQAIQMQQNHQHIYDVPQHFAQRFRVTNEEQRLLQQAAQQPLPDQMGGEGKTQRLSSLLPAEAMAAADTHVPYLPEFPPMPPLPPPGVDATEKPMIPTFPVMELTGFLPLESSGNKVKAGTRTMPMETSKPSNEETVRKSNADISEKEGGCINARPTEPIVLNSSAEALQSSKEKDARGDVTDAADDADARQDEPVTEGTPVNASKSARERNTQKRIKPGTRSSVLFDQDREGTVAKVKKKERAGIGKESTSTATKADKVACFKTSNISVDYSDAKNEDAARIPGKRGSVLEGGGNGVVRTTSRGRPIKSTATSDGNKTELDRLRVEVELLSALALREQRRADKAEELLEKFKRSTEEAQTPASKQMRTKRGDAADQNGVRGTKFESKCDGGRGKRKSVEKESLSAQEERAKRLKRGSMTKHVKNEGRQQAVPTIELGTKIMKYFQGKYFEGTVTSLRGKSSPCFHVVYTDGDKEDMSAEEVWAGASVGLIETGHMQPSVFVPGDHVIVNDGYSAIVRTFRPTKTSVSTDERHSWTYLVHYVGWKSRYDKWVDEVDLREVTAATIKWGEQVRQKSAPSKNKVEDPTTRRPA